LGVLGRAGLTVALPEDFPNEVILSATCSGSRIGLLVIKQCGISAIASMKASASVECPRDKEHHPYQSGDRKWTDFPILE
jgi:hypothetical protein